MAGLDDAGMNRADRDFEDAFALDVTKPVLTLLPADRFIPQELFHQWMGALRPVLVANQAAEIRMAVRDQPEQIPDFPLIPLRRMYSEQARPTVPIMNRMTDDSASI